MKKLKFLLPLITCLVFLITGVILLLIGVNSFLAVSLIIFGTMGLLLTVFLKISQKKMENFKVEADDEFAGIANAVNQKIREYAEEIATEQSAKESHKKTTCHYCKCKYDSALTRCPNCGAPPEGEI